MTIADLPPDRRLGGVRFIYPGDGKKYYWVSQWEKGVWGRREKESEQVFPLFVEDLKEVLSWTVVET